MSCNVFANNNEIACKAGSGKVIAAFPDVCLSPPSPPAGPVPIPYPDTSFSKDTMNGSKTVKIKNQEVMLKNQSFYKTAPLGDEAATNGLGAGVVSHSITGKTYFIMWSMDVKFESQNADRHIDITTSNHMSQPGNEGVPMVNLGTMTPPPAETDVCECCGEAPHSEAQRRGETITEAEFYSGHPDGQEILDLARNYPPENPGKCAHLVPPAPPTDDPCARYYRNDAAENRAARQRFSEAGASPTMNPNSLPHIHGQGRMAHRVPLSAGGCPIGPGNLAPVGDDPDCRALEDMLGPIQQTCAGR